MVSTAGIHTVNVLLDDGVGGSGYLTPAAGYEHPVRLNPQAVVPLDANADGLVDVAVPCKDSDAVVVLLATGAGTLQQAKRVAVGDRPLGAAAADLDRDGDLDLAVANATGNSVSVRLNTTLRQVEDWIAAGVPVIASIAWREGELTGAPIPSSSGHLVTIVGFDAQGNPIVNDPAAATDSDVQRTYIRSEFETVWLKSSGGVVYVMYPVSATVSGLP